VYAGTRFDFAPIPRKRGPVVNVQNKGLLDPTDVGSDQKTPIQPVVAFSLRSALPPSFPGFVFGGVGNYEGIKGSFDLITVAQRSLNPLVGRGITQTDQPTAAPTLTDAPTPDFQNGRDLQEEENEEDRTATTKDDVTTQSSSNNNMEEVEEENEEQQERDLQRDSNDFFDDNETVIVQKIFLVTNIRLPLGPKAI
jgi:hypothetical protein